MSGRSPRRLGSLPIALLRMLRDDVPVHTGRSLRRGPVGLGLAVLIGAAAGCFVLKAAEYLRKFLLKWHLETQRVVN